MWFKAAGVVPVETVLYYCTVYTILHHTTICAMLEYYLQWCSVPLYMAHSWQEQGKPVKDHVQCGSSQPRSSHGAYAYLCDNTFAERPRLMDRHKRRKRDPISPARVASIHKKTRPDQSFIERFPVFRGKGWVRESSGPEKGAGWKKRDGTRRGYMLVFCFLCSAPSRF